MTYMKISTNSNNDKENDENDKKTLVHTWCRRFIFREEHN